MVEKSMGKNNYKSINIHIIKSLEQLHDKNCFLWRFLRSWVTKYRNKISSNDRKAFVCQMALFITIQGLKGMRQWPINWWTFVMMIHKITPSVDYIKWLKGCHTSCWQTNQNSLKVLKVVQPTNQKTLI